MNQVVTFLSRWTWGERGHQNEVVRVFVLDDDGQLRARVYGAGRDGVELLQEEPLSAYGRATRGGWSLTTSSGMQWTARSPGCSCRVPAVLKRLTDVSQVPV